jgi:Ca2+-transporting ATPase
VAREAADLVLVDDNFASIVRGMQLGRRIFGNLQKSMQYIFAIHIPIAGMALVPRVMGWPAIRPLRLWFSDQTAGQLTTTRKPPRSGLRPKLTCKR